MFPNCSPSRASLPPQDVVDAAIEKLRELKSVLDAKQKAYEAATGKTTSLDKEAFRATLANVLERRLFYIPSFKIYGAVAGFYDYGPPGCAIKQNVTQFWRQHFVLEESMLEVGKSEGGALRSWPKNVRFVLGLEILFACGIFVGRCL